MTGRTAVVFEETVAVASPGRDPGPGRLRPHHVLVLSLWCGLVVGPVEVAAIVVRKHTMDLNQLYGMSRHFLWLIPLSDLLIFLVVGLACWPLTLCGLAGRWLAARLLATLAFLGPLWAAFPGIYGPAGFLLALGLAARCVPVLERRAAGFRRGVAWSFPVAMVLTPLLAASVWVGDRLEARREAERPLPPSGSPNVLLIVLDTVGADHLGLHGYHRPTSPILDALARRGIRFDRAQATSSWTLPSHAGFFTGRWPHELSASWFTPLDATHPTLAEYLGSRGYATAGFVANLVYCGVDTGLSRGFTVYQDYIFPELSAFRLAALIDRPLEGLRSADRALREHLGLDVLRSWVRPIWGRFHAGSRKEAEVVHREFLDWLSSRPRPERPFFAFLNDFDAHYPYELAAGGVHRFAARPRNPREAELLQNWWYVDKRRLSRAEIDYVRDYYDDCVADLDERLGRLVGELERRGILETTWLIVTSDHGESFGEQPGIFGHGTSLYQPQVQVPLVIVPPARERQPAPRVVTETASLRDLPATVVDLLGLEAGAPFPGESLAGLWGRGPAPPGRPARPPEPALSEVVPIDPVRPETAKMLEDRRALAALAAGDWIYIRREGLPPEELFDLRADDRERHDLAGDPDARPVLERLRRDLDRMTDGPLTHHRFNP